MKLQLPILITTTLALMYQAPQRLNPELPRPAGLTEIKADVLVTDLRVGGSPSDYTFYVSLRSDDTGCEQYADWWEVVDKQGRLVYRRILGHSHPGEQPFTRSGGPVPIAEDQEVYVRGHMNHTGYGSGWFKGSVSGGFGRVNAEPGFAANLEDDPPLPEGCAF